MVAVIEQQLVPLDFKSRIKIDMTKKKFSTLPQDNKLVDILTTIGEIIILNILLIVCCLPVITFVPAFTSFYYAMIKSVRKGIGNPFSEFWSSMKRTLVKGMLLSAILIVWGTLLGYSYSVMKGNTERSNILMLTVLVLIVITVFILVYIFAVFSRFDVGIIKILKLSFLMSIRDFYFTIPLIVLGALIIGIQFYFLPMICVCFTPSVYVYISTYMVEKTLRKYTPPPKAGQEMWYDSEFEYKSSEREGIQSGCESND